MKYKINNTEDDCTCLECGKSIYGRKDRKFCSLLCKNGYNNRKHRNIRLYKTGIVEQLHKNYAILEALLNNGVARISREKIVSMGFDDKVFTGSRKGVTHHEECSCFDITYSRSESRIFQIHRESI